MPNPSAGRQRLPAGYDPEYQRALEVNPSNNRNVGSGYAGGPNGKGRRGSRRRRSRKTPK